MGNDTSKLSHTSENALQLLTKFDTVIVVDDSGSMRGERWKEAGKALAKLAAVASKYDDDGIEIRFLNSTEVARRVTTPESVKTLFESVRPRSSTPIGETLNRLLEEYLVKYRMDEGIKPLNVIVITDGEPTDEDDMKPEAVIVKYAKELDDSHAPLSQVGIQFVQVGDDIAATEFLEKLDNELKRGHSIRDMIDTTVSERGKKLDMIKILTGGINRRVDEKGAKSVA